ncbi:energy transducer TonB [Massilia sp. Dwa41.01b]|nr:energy transducer TonB [Massilia sp. Dwa41.01b]QNB01530.1 energy transducer TonB [Massilia sp. Se16.2.3]
MPLCAQAQFVSTKKLPSVARPGPGGPCKKPEYPMSAARNNEEGVVTLAYLVDKDGAILDGKIVKSSGFSTLDRTALVELAKCAYKIPEGATEPAWVSFNYTWSLE